MASASEKLHILLLVLTISTAVEPYALYLATEWQRHAGEMHLSAVTGKAGLHHALRSPCWTPGQYMSQVKQLRYTHCCWAAEGSLRRPQIPKVTQNLKDHLKCKT